MVMPRLRIIELFFGAYQEMLLNRGDKKYIYIYYQMHVLLYCIQYYSTKYFEVAMPISFPLSTQQNPHILINLL
jgi:hypothetical protein